MPFSTFFQSNYSDLCTYPYFPMSSFDQYSTQYCFQATGCFLTTINIVKALERGMNPVAMTIIKSLERILAEPQIEPATCCPKVLYATDYVMGLGLNYFLQILSIWTSLAMYCLVRVN